MFIDGPEPLLLDSHPVIPEVYSPVSPPVRGRQSKVQRLPIIGVCGPNSQRRGVEPGSITKVPTPGDLGPSVGRILVPVWVFWSPRETQVLVCVGARVGE